jgi:hypothetical protein
MPLYGPSRHKKYTRTGCILSSLSYLTVFTTYKNLKSLFFLLASDSHFIHAMNETNKNIAVENAITICDPPTDRNITNADMLEITKANCPSVFLLAINHTPTIFQAD